MKNITYLIGAGASAKNALPVMKGLDKQFEYFIEYVESLSKNSFHANKKQKTCSQLKLTFEQIQRHASPDTYARKLFLRERPMDKDELIKLKYFLSMYFVWEQSNVEKGIKINISSDIFTNKPPKLDDRYDVFYANVLTKNALRLQSNINIISWNYDYQFELAYEEYSSFENAYENLKIYPHPVKEQSHEQVKFVKLNGTAGQFAFSESKVEYLQQLHSDFKPNILTLINDYSAWLNEKNSWTRKPFLNFAWEGNVISKLAIEHAKRIILDTNILVVIGYSFPLFNREVDRKIFSDKGRIKKAFIQDPSDDISEIIDRFENVVNQRDGEWNLSLENGNVFHKKGADQFYIP